MRLVPVRVVCLVLVAGVVVCAEPNDPAAGSPVVKAAVIVCEGMIDEGLFRSIQRRTQMALDDDVEYLIYEISTYGGFVKSADDISKYFVLDIGNKAHTVAYVTTEAISAGAMISVSCRDIIMLDNTTIGDCAPIVLSPGQKLEGVEREKQESFIRATFDRAAEENNYPSALLRAMVTMQIQVYRIKNLKTGEYEFFEDDELPRDANEFDMTSKQIVVKDSEILTLTASRAKEYGIARAVVKDRAEALTFLAKREGVTFDRDVRVYKTLWSEEMVRWLNSPGVMAVLVMIAMLGIYIEFNTPGLGLPGLAAAICFVIIIGSKHLVGLANWIEVALFVAGILLLLIEFLVLPGFGIAGVLGFICLFAGMLGMLYENLPDDDSPWPWPRGEIAWNDFTAGVMALALGFVGFLVLAWLSSRYLPRLRFLSGLILVPASAGQGRAMPVSMTAAPDSGKKGVEVGDSGEVLSTLRPTGRARFGDAIVDVVAEAEFLDKGTRVKIIEIHGNRVVVKAMDEQS